MSTVAEYETMVAGMVAMKIPREKAEAAARAELGMKTELEQLRDDADAEALEDDVVADGDRMMQALGFTVVKFSQKRRSKVTEGIPDRRYYHVRRGHVLWWEAKAESGRQRPAQRDFQALCEACDDPYVLGGLEALRTHLTFNGIATFDARGLPHPIPFTEDTP